MLAGGVRACSVTRHLYQDQQVGRVTVFECQHGATGVMQRVVVPGRRMPVPHWETATSERVFGCSLILAGSLQVELPERRLQVPAGDCIQITGCPPTDYRILPSPDAWELGLNLDGATGARLQALGLWEGARVQGICGDPAGIQRHLRDLAAACRDESRPPTEVLRAAIACLGDIYAAWRWSSGGDAFRDRACQLLHQHPEPGFDMRQAAAHLGLGYDVFRRRFTSALGCSPASFQRDVRMELARRLLRQNGVAAVAELLGYSDAFSFSRQFRRWHGCSPRDFQSRLQDGGPAAGA